MGFDPRYVAQVFNDNFEDAKALFLAPMMPILYAHLRMCFRAAIGAVRTPLLDRSAAL